jgi:protein-disulfide isomerase
MLRSRALLLAAALAVLVTSALIAVSLRGAQDSEIETTPIVPATVTVGRDALLRGVPQDGIVLGRADAPVTVVEYADLQCPYCAQWSRDVFPSVVDDYVRTGRVRIVFRGLAFLGPDSDTALRAALAAGEQDRLWDVVHALFSRQGGENEGWVTQGLLRSLGALGVDADKMFAESESPAVARELDAAARAARAAQVPGTPYFEAGPTGGTMTPLRLRALDAESFAAEIDRLLKA